MFNHQHWIIITHQCLKLANCSGLTIYFHIFVLKSFKTVWINKMYVLK
ncbi:hypothetical protein DOY81_005026, partial [Sarcophaga bullata]